MLFEPGKIFNRRSEIHTRFSGQPQGGISTPSQYPYVLIFTGESGKIYGYSDEFQEDGTFRYFGEGQEGDMQMSRGNKAIRDHKKNGRELHLFESLSNHQVRYVGEAFYLTHHIEQRPDVNGSLRDAIVFELAVESTDQDMAFKPPEIEDEHERPSKLWSLNMDELQQLANQRQTARKTVQENRRTIQIRSDAVKIYALRRANGFCEACNQAAPFLNKKGKPYLEPHHVHRISDGGPDDTRHVAAICPTCHRRVHYGKDGEEYNHIIINNSTFGVRVTF